MRNLAIAIGASCLLDASAFSGSVYGKQSRHDSHHQQPHNNQQYDPQSVVPLALVEVVGDYIQPIATGAFLADHPGALPAFEHAALDVAAGTEGDCAIGPHCIAIEKLVLNIAARLRER